MKFMVPYGRRKHDELECVGGPPSRERKLKSTNRRASRRLLHKQGRNDNKNVVASSMEALFTERGAR
jgi:hypothetical protein